MCAQVIKQADGRKVIFLNVRFSPAQHRALTKRARENERTLAAEIRIAVQRHLAAEDAA